MQNPHTIIKPLLDTLFAPEERRIAKAIDQLCIANVEASKMALDGFMYNGKFYRWSQAAAGSGVRRTLHLSLWPDIDKLLADEKQCAEDRQLIGQLLFKLIEPCGLTTDIYQDIRDATPEPIADLLPPEIANLDRVRQPGYFLNHPRDFRLYARLLPKIEFYSATRFIY